MSSSVSNLELAYIVFVSFSLLKFGETFLEIDGYLVELIDK